ncbi:MAG: hypothetical protein ACLFWF_11720 [Alphaproteobacteria bacterium]
MKNVLLPIVTAALLVCSPAAAQTRSPDPCVSGERAGAAPHGAHAPARHAKPGAARASAGCARLLKAQFQTAQRALSEKEVERALKRQGFRGRLVTMFDNERGVNEIVVLWETAGSRALRKLIVDAKTGKFKREEKR